MSLTDWIIAGAALVTAVATVFVAWWGIGTWRLFNLERRRQAGLEAGAKERIRRLTTHVLERLDALIEHLQKPRNGPYLSLRDLQTHIGAIVASQADAQTIGPNAVEVLHRIWTLWELPAASAGGGGDPARRGPLRTYSPLAQGDRSLVGDFKELRREIATLHGIVRA